MKKTVTDGRKTAEGTEIWSVPVESLLEQRGYRKYTGGLGKDGVPWMPLVASNTYLSMSSRSCLHRHPGHVEVFFCRRGVFEYESLGRVYRVTPGCVFVSRPDEPHQALAEHAGQANYSLLFKLGGKHGWSGTDADVRFLEKRLRTMPRLFHGGPTVARKFAQLIRLMESDFTDKTERRLRIRLAAISLLLAVVDASSSSSACGTSGRLVALSKEIREHPEVERSIEEMARCVGMSPSSLTTAFKRSVGHTPHAYLIKCRIDRAKEALKRGSTSISSLAISLGFPSAQHFATSFRKFTGLSPRDWARDNCS